MSKPIDPKYALLCFDEEVLAWVQACNLAAGNSWQAGQTAFYDGFIGVPAAAGDRTDKKETGTRLAMAMARAPVASEVPGQVNLATDPDDLVSPVQYQGYCAACTAFATTAAMETFMRGGSPRVEDFKLSEAHLFFGNTLDPNCCWVGWTVEEALYYASGNFIVSAASYPYRAHNQEPVFETGPPRARIVEHATYPNQDVQHVKEHLSNGRPAIATLDFHPDLFLYQGGIYRNSHRPELDPPEPPDGLEWLKQFPVETYGHALCVVGYDDEAQAWLCKNSFGTNWGVPPTQAPTDTEAPDGGGFIWVGYGELGIDDFMWVITSMKVEVKPKVVDVS